MILVFGGAYNGKLDFVKDKYNVSEEDIYFCSDEKLKYDKKVICGLHLYVRFCVLNNIDSISEIKNNIELLKDKIIICDEIGSGIVPMQKEDRIWREQTGKVMQLLSRNSDSISRVFFGIEERLK